jgi:hypothetical protein
MTQVDINELTNLQDLEQIAAKNGIRFTKADYKNIRKAQDEARQNYEIERAAELEAAGNTWADRFMRWYPKLLETIANAGNILITISQSLIVNIGVPLVLILLLIVEQQRVYHGIELFEVNQGLAAFAATSLVVLNLVLEVIAYHVEYTKGYEAERDKRWSLRIAFRNFLYRIGWGDDWRVQQLSPAQWAHSLLRIVTFTILALALAGSMKVVIQQQSGAWYSALWAILTQSNLLDMMTWLGGLLFAAAAVFSAQGLSRYVAIRTVEIRASMVVSNNDDLQDATDQAAATAAYAILVDKMQKQGVTVHENFTLAPLPQYSMSGNGTNHHNNGNGVRT